MGLAPGSRVILATMPPYLKSADPMPMLRPPDLVAPGEEGEVVEVRAGGTLAVRFRRGTFLMDRNALQPCPPAGS
jgi:hypothetical protein